MLRFEFGKEQVMYAIGKEIIITATLAHTHTHTDTLVRNPLTVTHAMTAKRTLPTCRSITIGCTSTPRRPRLADQAHGHSRLPGSHWTNGVHLGVGYCTDPPHTHTHHAAKKKNKRYT